MFGSHALISKLDILAPSRVGMLKIIVLVITISAVIKLIGPIGN